MANINMPLNGANISRYFGSLKRRAWQYRQDIFYLATLFLVASISILGPRLQALQYGLLDPSFNFAVNTAGAQQLAFGTEFIATYGPLGYLVSNYLPDRLFIVSTWLFLHVVLTTIAIFLFTKLSINKWQLRWLAGIALVYLLGVASRGGFIEWSYLMMFVLYCFIYARVSERSKVGLAILLTALSVIFMLTKFTLGMASIAVLLSTVLLSGESAIKRRFLMAGGIVGVGIIVFYIVARRLGIESIVEYVRTALLVSGKFSSAMAYYDEQTLPATVAVLIAISSLIIWIIWRERKLAYRYIFLVPVLAVVWKYAVVRQDGHILVVLMTVVPLTVIYLFSITKRKASDGFIAIFIISACFLAIWANKIPFYGHGGFADIATTPISRLANKDIARYFNPAQQKKEWSTLSAQQLGAAALPESMRSRIGNSGVDVFPWETVIIAANNLKWQGRPSPFSFETYDPFLDKANAAFISSSDAPKYIVWHSMNNGMYGVDYRNILWDEPLTLRTILANYKLVDSSSGFMLLERLGTPRDVGFDKIDFTQEFEVRNEWVRLPENTDDDPDVLSFKTPELPREKLQELIIRAPQYYIEAKTIEGDKFTYKFVKENSESGFIINSLPITWEELISFISNPEDLNPSREIVEVRMFTRD